MKLTNALLRKAHAAAVRHSELSAKITAAFQARYGATHSDVDCDELIDTLDYGAGDIVTVEECDAIMSRYGRSPLPQERGPDRG